MASTRSRLMLEMAKKEADILSNLNLPKYESTKGTTKHEQQLAISGWKPLQINNEVISSYLDDSVSEDKTSGSEYRPSGSSSDSDDTDKCIARKLHTVTTSQQKQGVNTSDHNIQTEPVLNNNSPKIRIHSVVSIRAADSTSNASTVVNTGLSTNPESLRITAAKKSTTGKRIRNKRHSCYFCHDMVIHMARHLEVKHGDEMDVAKVMALEKKCMKRKQLLSEIVRAGDFHYNCNAISLKSGELILVRRPTTEEIKINKYSDYGPCPNCLGFMLKKHLWHHLKTACKQKRTDENEEPDGVNRQVIAESNAILSNVFGSEFSIDYKNHIVNTFRDDDIGSYCREDCLILKFGAMLYEKYGLTQCELIRQSMRQLARLTLEIREKSIQNFQLIDLLTPQKFDTIIHGVKALCGSVPNNSTRRPEFLIPSLALKIGHALKKCANIERGLAMRKGDLKRNESLMSFIDLMDMEWQTRISSNALSTLHKRKLNAGQLLPLTSDIQTFNKYIKKEIEKAQTCLREFSSPENWSRLATLILCRIILFNKRRAGEASKITIEQYTTRPCWSQQANEEMKNSLTTYEMLLAQRLAVVNIIGKRGRKVPVILTSETKEGIDILLKQRSAAGISEKNPYIFARGNQALTNMRGTDALRKIVNEVPLEQPKYLTGTHLRKYVATVCQVFDLTENEYDWLARHLGHDIRVHREFYRLHEDTVELTKVSRLLMAVDAGEANKFSGKQLKDIQLKDLPPVEEDNVEENNSEEEDTLEQAVLEDFTNSRLTENIRPTIYERESDIQNKRLKTKEPNKVCKSKGFTNACQKTPWTMEDKKCVFHYFKIQIKNGIVPGKKDCEVCQDKYPTLKSRKWTDLKFCVKNQISKIRKLKQI